MNFRALPIPGYHIPLFPERQSHIFSWAVGSEKLFLDDENYRYFLQKLHEHISSVCDIWSYCLLPNHFHLLVEIKPESEIQAAFQQLKKSKIYEPEIE